MAKVPYELLVRWNHETGVLQGAHVKLFDNTLMKEGDAQSVAVAGASGFPLADVLDAVHIGAIAAFDAEVAAHAATILEKDAEIAALRNT